MTLALSLVGPESLWTVVDRRLTAGTRTVRDDARKIMFLETKDGVAILAYAGVGATGAGTEPADWMSAVLRGRDWPLEDSLRALAEALRRQMPRHLATLARSGSAAHHVLVAAFHEGAARLYTIGLAVDHRESEIAFRHTRWVVGHEGDSSRTPRFGLAGSGASVLAKDPLWQRQLLRLVKAHDRRLIRPTVVADAFARINLHVANALADGTVGPRCIVAWRHRKQGVHKGGGGHQCYTGTERESNTPSLPMIGSGMDVQAITGAIMPLMMKQLANLRRGATPPVDGSAINEVLSRLPETPDETLR